MRSATFESSAVERQLHVVAGVCAVRGILMCRLYLEAENRVLYDRWRNFDDT